MRRLLEDDMNLITITRRILIAGAFAAALPLAAHAFDPGAKIGVHFHNCEESVMILEGEAKAFAEKARTEWKTEWVTQHKGSYARWLWSRVRQASFAGILTALFLIALVAVMLFYPLAYVFR